MRVICHAGNRPMSRPHAIMSVPLKARTRRSIENCGSIEAIRAGRIETTWWRPTAASASPSPAPATDSIMLSVSVWRISRPRAAPMASRTAASRRRLVARASSRFVMLAQAISNTSATAPRSANPTGRSRPVTACAQVSASSRQPSYSGNCPPCSVAVRAAIVASSVFACWSVVESANRARIEN